MNCSWIFSLLNRRRMLLLISSRSSHVALLQIAIMRSSRVWRSIGGGGYGQSARTVLSTTGCGGLTSDDTHDSVLLTRDVLGPCPNPKTRRPEAIFPGPIRPEKKSSGFRA